MKKEELYFRLIGSYLALALFIAGSFPGDVFAGFIPSRALYGSEGPERGADLERIRQVLETRVVSQRMADLGFTRGEMDQRLSELDDATLHDVATNLDLLLQKGGDGVLGTVIALLVIAILVVVLLQLSGRKIIIE